MSRKKYAAVTKSKVIVVKPRLPALILLCRAYCWVQSLQLV